LSPSSITPILLLTSLSLFWGLNWPGMKIILSELTVWWFRALCLIVGEKVGIADLLALLLVLSALVLVLLIPAWKSHRIARRS